VLGLIAADATSTLLPPSARPFLSVIGNLGLIVFMFLVGLDIDLRVLRARTRTAVRISLASVGLPFALGIGLALWLHDGREDSIGLLPFALFIGTAVSVTAFPVLARIIADSGLRQTELGMLVLACAAFEDVIAWTLLACALAAAAADGLWDLPGTLAATIAFAVAVIFAGRPLLRRLVGRVGHRHGLVVLAVCGATASACVTSELGTHLVFGAFVFGVAFPRDVTVLSALERDLAPVTTSVLLPVFFVLPGLQLDLWESGASGVWQLAAILVVACVGKLVGAAGAALRTGLPWRDATAIGVLINTRGLMEIVVLNVGLSAAVIDRQLYGLFVVMAIVTTLMAGPLLSAIYRDGQVPTHLGSRVRGRLSLGSVSARSQGALADQ
jgi:K+:H+ antiporter